MLGIRPGAGHDPGQARRSRGIRPPRQEILHARSTRPASDRAILPRMSAPRAQALLRRLLCLLLAVSLAAPSLGSAHAARGQAAPETVSAADAEPPCPMHAAAAQVNATAAATADLDEVADCCKHDTVLHAGCAEDCRDCAGGCAGLRLPAGLDATALVLPNPPMACAPANTCAQPRPDAPQPNLLRPPAPV